MRKTVLYAVIVVFACRQACAQGTYEYYYNNAPPEEQSREPVSDMGLFMLPPGGMGHLFRSFSEFNFSAVKYNRRGYTEGLTRDFWGATDLSGIVSHSPDYSFLSYLKRADVTQTDHPLSDRSHFNFDIDAASYRYPDELRSILQPGMRASVYTYNRRGRLGVRFSAAADTPSVFAGVALNHRWGRDPDIGGVFTQEPSLLAGFDRIISENHRISLIVCAAAAENGLRTYASAEAFGLTGDNYYNPSWGWYGGRERSAKTLRKLNIFPLLIYSGRLSGSTTLSASAYFRIGIEKRSSLSWFDAQNPYPDYYRYMPGYESSNLASGWMGNDPRVTQIYWEQLVEQNLNNPQQVRYIVADRVEGIRNAQFSAEAATQPGDGFTLVYGVRFNSDERAYYKELSDLLGAAPMLDVDQYLLDDDIFGEYHHNDKRNPERLVAEGDRFGYNYRLTAVKTDLHAALNYADAGFRAGAGIEAGQGKLYREGLYEKELFPGNGSYGRSKMHVFNTFTLKAAAAYSFSPRRSVWVSAVAAENMPYAGTLFLNPDYSNYAIEKPRTVGVLSVDAGWSAINDRHTLNLSAFATRTSGESAVYRYWDDIEGVYANMALTDIDKLYYGVELAAQYELSQRFTLNLTASAGSYAYDSDPRATIINDATRHTIISESASRLKGCRLATSPQNVVSGELRYATWGWIASITASYMGGRYVAVSPLRRMERAFGLAESPEKHRDFITQEPLADAFVMNLFLLRSFGMKNGTVTAFVSVNNLLGNSDIIYNGFEQMRIGRNGSAPNYNWRPFPSKYLFAYGRTYYISLSYSFK